MKQEDKNYWIDTYQRILGVRPETFNEIFDTDSLEEKLKEFVKKYPNDGELGGKIRIFIQEL